jgi:NADPH2:quinone reductase
MPAGVWMTAYQSTHTVTKAPAAPAPAAGAATTAAGGTTGGSAATPAASGSSTGAAGGVGTATLQVARGLGIRTIGVVSTAEKAAFARAAGADETVPADGFKDAVTRLTGGRGVDAVVDVVGGDSFTDSLRCLGEQGRLLVVGFASGQGIPEVRVNRLLLNNVDVRGVGLGAFAMTKPAFLREQWDLLRPMLESGSVRPAIGATYDLDGFPRALQDLADRRTLGKSVVRIR